MDALAKNDPIERRMVKPVSVKPPQSTDVGYELDIVAITAKLKITATTEQEGFAYASDGVIIL